MRAGNERGHAADRDIPYATRGGKMSTPNSHQAALHELELTVKVELTVAETSEPAEEAVDAPIDEWLFDPADTEREEVGLRSLLGAVQALEDGESDRT